MDKNINSIKKEIIFWSKRLYEAGMSPSFSGNISARFKENFLVSASGTCLNELDNSDIILIDKNTKVVDKSTKKPTSEKLMHVEIYKQRSDINAIIHCHCPILTAFAISGVELNKPILPDFVVMFEKVKILPFYTPSTKELAMKVKEVFKKDNVVLLKNHGIILGASDLKAAFYQLESLRAYAQTYIYSKLIGNGTIKSISKSKVAEIKSLYKK